MHFRSCRAIQAGVDGTGAVTQGPFYLCISINNLVFGKPLKRKFVLLLPNDCSGRWWDGRAAACPAGRYGQWRVQTHTNVFWNGKWGYFTGPHNVKDLFEGQDLVLGLKLELGWCVCVCVFTSGGLRSWCIPDHPAHVDKNRQQRENHKDAETLRGHQRLGSEPADRIQQQQQQPLVASYPPSLIFSSLFPLQRHPPPAAHGRLPDTVKCFVMACDTYVTSSKHNSFKQKQYSVQRKLKKYMFWKVILSILHAQTNISIIGIRQLLKQ